MHTLKSLEELQLKTSDIVDILPKRMATFVEEVAREVRYGRQLLRLNTQLVNTKGRSVHLPRRGSISAVRISEAATPTEQNVSWATTEVTPFKIGTQLYITQESIDGTEIEVINGSIEEAGIAMAVSEDTEIFSEIMGRQPDPVAAAGVWAWTAEADPFVGDGATVLFTLDNDIVIEVDSVTVAGTATTAYTMDYYDGKISFTTAPTSGAAVIVNYWYSNRTSYQDANTDASFKYEDIVAAKTTMRGDKIVTDVCVLNPDEFADLILDSRFIDASQYGSREPILNGEVGKAAGVRILITTAVPSGTSIFMATSRAGWHVMKRNIDLKRKESQETDSYKFFFYEEFAPAITDETAVIVCVNHAADSANL